MNKKYEELTFKELVNKSKKGLEQLTMIGEIMDNLRAEVNEMEVEILERVLKEAEVET